MWFFYGVSSRWPLESKFRRFFSFRVASMVRRRPSLAAYEQPLPTQTISSAYSNDNDNNNHETTTINQTAILSFLADSTDNTHHLYRQCLKLRLLKVSSPLQSPCRRAISALQAEASFTNKLLQPPMPLLLSVPASIHLHASNYPAQQSFGPSAPTRPTPQKTSSTSPSPYLMSKPPS